MVDAVWRKDRWCGVVGYEHRHGRLMHWVQVKGQSASEAEGMHGYEKD